VRHHRRAIDAYAVAVDADGRVLMAAGPDPDLPGGPVRHGEHPADAIGRLLREQTGRSVARAALRSVLTEIDGRTHRDVLIFDVTLVAGELGEDGLWRPPSEGVRAGRVFGVSAPDIHQHRPGVRVHWPHDRVQRFAAYGFATDPAGRVLLTLISDNYPGAGRWHLPGGGTDFGESPVVGLAREVEEETGQHGVIGELLSLSHRYQTDARGPEGRPMDWHGVRVVYRVRIEEPTEPRVLDRGGSTAAASWFSAREALTLPLTEVAQEALAQYVGGDR
jgi:ADP-ribose pyrophosphatase YjhB (NUDIX family)